MLRVSDAHDVNDFCSFSQFDFCGFIDKSPKQSRWVVASEDAIPDNIGQYFTKMDTFCTFSVYLLPLVSSVTLTCLFCR